MIPAPTSHSAVPPEFVTTASCDGDRVEGFAERPAGPGEKRREKWLVEGGGVRVADEVTPPALQQALRDEMRQLALVGKAEVGVLETPVRARQRELGPTRLLPDGGQTFATLQRDHDGRRAVGLAVQVEPAAVVEIEGERARDLAKALALAHAPGGVQSACVHAGDAGTGQECEEIDEVDRVAREVPRATLHAHAERRGVAERIAQ